MTLAALGWNGEWQHKFEPYCSDRLAPGRVVGEHRTHYQVNTGEIELSAEITGRLRNSADQRSDLPGVGDFVAVRPADGDGPATIEAVLARTSALIRKASGEERPQLLAANVDVAFIVMGLDGDYNLARLKRFLAVVRDSGAMPVIVANKVDLFGEADIVTEIGEAAGGVPVHPISARDGSGVQALEVYFEGNRTAVLIGSSGVGKSTLTNQLLGRAAQATQEVRAHDSRGRHTTTHRQLFLRPNGGAMIDTPGMRGLETWNATEVVEANFDDIEALASACRFRDCKHRSEPGCAVLTAVARGELDAGRVATFISAPRRAR